MVLNEKHNEHNRQKWLSRASRERMNLSASVEESLKDSVADKVFGGEELEGQANFSESGQRKGVFPPRLSLQSRPIPALSPDISQEENVDASLIQPVEQERKPAAPSQNTNILKRFAQRFTSSFAAVGGTRHSEEIEPSRRFSEEVLLSESVPPKAADEGIQQVYEVIDSLPQERAVHRYLIPSGDGDESRERQGKQRLARTTRIHLETPPVITTARSSQPEETKAETMYRDTLQRNSPAGVNEPDPQVKDDKIEPPTASAVSANPPGSVNMPNSSMPTSTRQIPVEVNKTGARLPTVEALKGKSGGATRRELSGSGIFEPGQGDATVVNRYVTEASVVLVTLTANPGPVVIQYVTLRPRIGFTVHLTAPTTMRASFNYIVLLGELF